MVFTLACRWLAGIRKNVLSHGLFEFFAVTEGDFDTTWIWRACEGLILVASYLMTEEIAEFLLVFVP